MDNSKKTIAYERYIFNTLLQNRNENTIDWVDRLRRQALYCKFDNDESQIFDKIVEKTNISQLRKSAFEKVMSLTELLSYAARLERNEEMKMNQCPRCGYDDHKSGDKTCPGRGKVCKNCNGMGHLARACYKSLKRNSATENCEILKKVKIEECSKNELNSVNSNGKEKFAAKAKNDPRKRGFERESNLKINFQNSKLKFLKDDRDNLNFRNESIQKNQSTHSPSSQQEKSFSCRIGEVATRFTISDAYSVNVMSKKYFDAHNIKCGIFNNKEIVINEMKFTKALEAKVERYGVHINAEFYYTKEINEEKCVLTSHVARKLFPK